MASISLNADLGGLSRKQLERYYYLLPFFKEEAHIIVKMLQAKGKNSWASFQEKLNYINNASYQEKEYIDALYDIFDIGCEYPMDEIIQNVSTVRSDMKLESYDGSIKAKCENDLLRLFLADNVYEATDEPAAFKRKIVGYKPIFKIKPEQ